ncbi:MAG: hypothetical protein ACI8TL_001030 [Natronomonas sp.]|jgi:hypothetical protein
MSYGQQVRPLLGARLPTTPSMAAVLAGDLLVLLAFVATGQVSHGYVFWEAPARTVLITVPVAVGWLALAIPAGLFVPERLRLDTPSSTLIPAPLARFVPSKLALPKQLRNVSRLVLTIVVVWVGAALIGGAIRSTNLIPGSAPVSFLLANVVFGALFLVPWRVAVGWRLSR